VVRLASRTVTKISLAVVLFISAVMAGVGMPVLLRCELCFYIHRIIMVSSHRLHQLLCVTTTHPFTELLLLSSGTSPTSLVVPPLKQ
jgi:hypothetical protein